MSKKDRQHQHLQQPLTPQLANQPHPPIPDGAIPSVDETPALRASLREFQDLSAARAAEALDLKRDLDIIAKAARHGAPPDGFEPKTAEGKDALEQVVLLGSIAKGQREQVALERQQHATEHNELSETSAKKTADLLALHIVAEGGVMQEALTDAGRAALAAVATALEKRKALHSDLMVLEQTAAGRAPDIALQTDIGKSAAHALSEVITSLDKMNEARLDGPPLPLNGWSSDTARRLVEAVPPQERVLLLGDLLAQLLPHTGETGQNETASDVLKRLMEQLRNLEHALEAERRGGELVVREHRAMGERLATVQSAMVSRRAPDAVAGATLEGLASMLARVGRAPANDKHLLQEVDTIVSEWRGLRAFFSEAPFTAVSVRDDGANGPVRERYSLLVLSWDGKAVKTQVVEGTRPWGDISPYLDRTVRLHLIPGAYR